MYAKFNILRAQSSEDLRGRDSIHFQYPRGRGVMFIHMVDEFMFYLHNKESRQA